MRAQCIHSTEHGRAGGFTLIELLVVIGIIALLIGILLPVISRARERATQTACMGQMRTIGQALFMYAGSFRDRLPNGNPRGQWHDYTGSNQVMVAFARDFVRSAGPFRCPGDIDLPPDRIVTADQTLPNSARMSYEFYSLFWAPEYGPLLAKLKGKAPLAWDLDGGETSSPLLNHKGGGNVLIADGHVEWQPQKLWEDGSWPRPAGQYYPNP